MHSKSIYFIVLIVLSTQIVFISACRCPSTNKQVCGTDGVTYVNSCVLGCAALRNRKLQIDHKGSCRSG